MGTAFNLADVTRANRRARHGLDYYSPWDLTPSGKKKRKKEFFRTKEARENRRDELEKRWREFGENGEMPLTPSQNADYRAALALLPEGVNMRAAAAVYSQHLVKTGGKPLMDVFDAYAGPGGELYARGLEAGWVREVHATLTRFAASMPKSTTINGPRPDDIRLWLSKLRRDDGRPYADPSLHGFRRQLHGAFEWAAATEGLRDDNPVAVVSPPKINRSAPVFYDVNQTRAILAAAVSHDPGFVPVLVLRFFVGIRSSEVKRMLPSDVHASMRVIDLPGFRTVEGATKPQRVTKSGKRRIIEDAPAVVWDWLKRFPLALAPEKKSKPPVLACVVNYNKRFRAVIKASNMPMKSNALRHSFATYHVALKKSAHLTILILGQEEDSKVFYTFYRNPNVTVKMAKNYFALTPALVS